MYPPPNLQARDRVIILGRSGSGKTELAKDLLQTVPNVIIHDTKLNEDWSMVVDGNPPIIGDAIYRVKDGRYWWQPPDSFLTDRAHVEDHFERFYRAGSRVLYVDELLDIAPNAANFPNALKIISTRGRSAGVGLWTTTQRPYGIPLFALSEANHTFVFELKMDRDRQRVEEMTGGAKVDWRKIEGNHGFFYIDARGRVAGPYRLNLQGPPRR